MDRRRPAGLIAAEVDHDAAAEPDFIVQAPVLAGFPATSALLMAHLPLVDANSALREALIPRDRPQPNLYGAVLALDPFPRWEDLADELRAAGIEGVANFPTVTALDQEGQQVLEMAELGFDTELQRLAWFAARGFRCLCFVSNDAQAARAADRLGMALKALCYLDRWALSADPRRTSLPFVLEETDRLAGTDMAPSIPVLALARSDPA